MEALPLDEFYFGTPCDPDEIDGLGFGKLVGDATPTIDQTGWVVVKPLQLPEGTQWKVGTYVVRPLSSFPAWSEENASLISPDCVGTLEDRRFARGGMGEWNGASEGGAPLERPHLLACSEGASRTPSQ